MSNNFVERMENPGRIAELEDGLRELLSYCQTQDGRYLKPYEAYRDVAGKLAAILDGEQ